MFQIELRQAKLVVVISYESNFQILYLILSKIYGFSEKNYQKLLHKIKWQSEQSGLSPGIRAVLFFLVRCN